MKKTIQACLLLLSVLLLPHRVEAQLPLIGPAGRRPSPAEKPPRRGSHWDAARRTEPPPA